MKLSLEKNALMDYNLKSWDMHETPQLIFLALLQAFLVIHQQLQK